MVFRYSISSEIIFSSLEKLREKRPLVLNITNDVTPQTIANILLALGASPLMAKAPEEFVDLMADTNAVVINIGTLDANFVSASKKIQMLALDKKIPLILDPVGVGVSDFRKEVVKEILLSGVDILRGNASEILSIAGESLATKGVDSLAESRYASDIALGLSKQYDCCVVVSGQYDLICKENRILTLKNGDPMLTKVTGMGCSLSAMIAAFSSVIQDDLLASAAAISILNIAAEIAVSRSKGPGSFYSALLDAIYQISLDDLDALALGER